MNTFCRFALSLAAALSAALGPVIVTGAAPPAYQADVVVYGGSSAGVVAAVQAKRMGKSVLIVNPYTFLGGMTASGLNHADVNNPAAVSGITHEFFAQMGKAYGTDFAIAFEPHVAEGAFEDMVTKAGVTVHHGRRLDLKDGVVLEGTRIARVRTEDGSTFTGDMFIDASYEGDLMAKAGVTYIIGREGNAQYDETLNGFLRSGPGDLKRISDLGADDHFINDVDPFVEPGNAASGLLPWVTGTLLPQGAPDHRVQAFNYRLILTDAADNQIPFEKPDGYRELDHELLLRNLEAGDTRLPGRRAPVPNRKIDWNTFGPVGTDMAGANVDYADGDHATRLAIDRAHETYTRGHFWTLAHHPRVPAAIRNEMRRYGYAKDEFPRTGNFPPMLYLREGRRMVGDYVMTEAHCRHDEVAPDPVAVASYAMDSHVVQYILNERGIVEREGVFYKHAKGPYGVSYRSIVPKTGECPNLLVPVCVSASHVAFGSIRMEPVFMGLAQAAATAASLAIDRKCAVQDVPYAELRERLTADGVTPASHSRAAITNPRHEADVVVFGSTPTGVCAAIAAAREGAAVLLLEPTGHVGGVNTGGLSFSDSCQTDRTTLGGLFNEFHERLEKDYVARGQPAPYRTSIKDHATWTYEPHVAMRVTQAMLADAGVKVLTRERLAAVHMEAAGGRRITSLSTSHGRIVTGKVFIDATYEGDLMAAAGVSHAIGREGRKDYGESLAGKQYCAEKPAMRISGLDSHGKPLPLITDIDPEDAAAGQASDEAGDEAVIAYSFRLCLTENPANRVPMPQPARYDAARFEAIRRYYQAEPDGPLLWDLYPLPNRKFDANDGIHKQFSMSLVGGGNGWCAADAEGRKRIWEEHRQYTLEMYHFLTTDPAVPRAHRDRLARLGLCKDEFVDYGHWPPQLYVREGRRMRGQAVMTQADIMDNRTKPDPIAIGSFPLDTHDCRRVARGANEVVNEGTLLIYGPTPGHGPVYHVPYGAITPKEDEALNLLVPVALSATHVAYSSIRVEPTWMAIGQSAGIAAALAAKAAAAVQKVPYATLRARLLAQGQVLDLPDAAARPRNPPPNHGLGQ
jgi:flavin-dependent dehydrogenase